MEPRNFSVKNYITIIIVAVICLTVIFGEFGNLPTSSLAESLSNNSCETVQECIILSQISESSDFDSEEEDLINNIKTCATKNEGTCGISENHIKECNYHLMPIH